MDIAFSHIGLYVTDLDAMERFYRDMLGMTVTDRGDLGDHQLVFLSRNPAEHNQIVLVTGRPAGQRFTTINQISFRVAGIAVLREFLERLQKLEGAAPAPVTHGNAVSLYFYDPEGNRIEFFLDTEWYCEQPLRVPIDLAQSDAEILRGIEELCRRQPGFKPRDEWMREMTRRMSLS